MIDGYNGPAVGSTGKDGEDDDIKLQTHLVNLDVTAIDRAGRTIPGLKQDDFSVYEDEVLQQVSHFSTEQNPFNLVLLLDMSGSVLAKRQLIKEAALHFIDVIDPQDKVAVISFTYDVSVVSHLTADRDDLRDSISTMVFPGGATFFYDALGYSLVQELRKVKGQRNAIVILSDGEDNAILYNILHQEAATGKDMMTGMTVLNGSFRIPGSFLRFDQLMDGIKEANVLIYPIRVDHGPDFMKDLLIANSSNGLPPPPDVMSPRVDAINARVTETAMGQLQELAEASGGRVFNAARIEDLKGIYEQVAGELRSVYSLSYTPNNPIFDGKFRRIRVKINKPSDAVSRTRPGYYAGK